MRISTALLVASLNLTALTAEVVAQTESHLGDISSDARTVSKVMVKAQCNLGWYAQVLLDSSIDPAQTNSLAVGRRLYLKNGDCKTQAPEAVRSLSEQLFEYEALQVENAKLHTEAVDASALNGELAKWADNLTEGKRVLEGRLRELNNQPAQTNRPKSPPGSNLVAPIAIGIVGLGLGLLVGHVRSERLRKKQVGFDLVRTIRVDGQKHEFHLVGAGKRIAGSAEVEPFYQHAPCGENKLSGDDSNLRRHVQQKCPKLLQSEIRVDPQLLQEDQ